MKTFHPIPAAACVALTAALTGCSGLKPAGSLGYAVDGETRLRPVPANYRHVPPRVEEPAPLLFKSTF